MKRISFCLLISLLFTQVTNGFFGAAIMKNIFNYGVKAPVSRFYNLNWKTKLAFIGSSVCAGAYGYYAGVPTMQAAATRLSSKGYKRLFRKYESLRDSYAEMIKIIEFVVQKQQMCMRPSNHKPQTVIQQINNNGAVQSSSSGVDSDNASKLFNIVSDLKDFSYFDLKAHYRRQLGLQLSPDGNVGRLRDARIILNAVPVKIRNYGERGTAFYTGFEWIDRIVHKQAAFLWQEKDPNALVMELGGAIDKGLKRFNDSTKNFDRKNKQAKELLFACGKNVIDACLKHAYYLQKRMKYMYYTARFGKLFRLF